MTVLFLAMRNLMLQRKRYLMVGAAVMLGFAIITVISGVSFGAMETVKAKAARYFAGHVSVTGYTFGRAGIDDPDAVENAIRDSGLPVRTVSGRTVYYKTDAALFFGGETVRQRRLVGIDFEAEREELATLAFVEGAVDSMRGSSGEHGIMISESAARIMGARLGDDLNLYLTTDSGQYNTATLIVRGIFSETSLFGYVAYMRNEDLNGLLLRSPDAATDIAVFARSGADIDELAEAVRTTLSANYIVFPALASKEDLYSEIAKGIGGNRLAVLSLDAHLAQIKSILDAFLVVTYFVLAVFVLIVMVGILNTYRVLVYERTREIGTMRALGMARGSVSALFLFEAIGLALIASVAGLMIGVSALWMIRFLDLGSLPVAGMFTNNGRLHFYLEPGSVVLNFCIMVGGVGMAALGPSRNASKIRPADAMRNNS